MGFIKAFAGAIGGTFADQWVDFLTIPAGLTPTAAVFPAVPQGQNAGRGSNTKGSTNIITKGSRIVVPEGYGLLTFEDGKITGYITEAGGYEYTTDNINSQSIFTGGGFVDALVKNAWERFKFGGQPGAQQIGLFVNLKEIPNNRFGTQSEIYWDDAYLNAQVGAITRGTYTLRITNPILFVAGFVPVVYQTGQQVFDFSDIDNPVGTQLFNEVVASLAPAFSKYTNDPDKGNRMSKLQSDSVGFAQSLSAAVEEGYQWTTDRGLQVVKVALTSIEYDADTTKLLSDVKKADALSGNRSGSFLNQAVARGVESAGETGGGAGLAMFGMGAGGVGGLVQPTTQEPVVPEAAPAPAAEEVSPAVKLKEYKALLDDDLITQEDYDQMKKNLLGL